MSIAARSVLFLALATHADAAREERLLRHEVVVDAPPADVWRMFATEEGMRSWVAPFVRIDLRIGGTIETSYDADAGPGDPGNIVQRILAYEPERMLAARTENAPAFPEGLDGVWGVTRFAPLPGGRTRVVGTMLGWKETAAADAAYAFFDRANPMVYESLRAHFEELRPDPEETLDALRRLAGIWRTESTVDGERVPVLLLVEGEVEGEVEVEVERHTLDRRFTGLGLAALHREEDAVAFLWTGRHDEHEKVAQGFVRLDPDHRTIRVYGDFRPLVEGTPTDFEATIRLPGDGASPRRLDFTVERPDDARRTVEYVRIEEIPEEFRRMPDELDEFAGEDG